MSEDGRAEETKPLPTMVSSDFRKEAGISDAVSS